MSRVHLMIEDFQADGKEGIDWGVDWGLKDGEELPEDPEDMTLAQYTIWKFITVLRGMADESIKTAVKKEVGKKKPGLLVPENMQ